VGIKYRYLGFLGNVRLNGFKDGTEMKVAPYESDTFVKDMEDTWNGLKPLYQQLHAYVRSRLLKL
jgi:peptidyl-dipeptidase A